MSILGVAAQNMLAHEDRLIGDTTPVKPHIRAWQKQISDRIAFSRFMLSLELPLTHTAIPSLGNVVPSFTRATTATGQKWDEAGYLDFTALAGEMVFKGARRVRNWIQAPTENWASAGWAKSGISVSGNRLTATGANGIIYDNAALSMGTGKTAVGSVTLSRVTGTGNIDVSTNGGTTWTTVSVTGARVSVSLTGNINGQFAIRIVTSGDAIDATYPQLEDVTGQTTQTASEYVSVGVPSDWAGTDLVTNGTFDTDTTGWTTSDSTFTASGGQATLTATSNTADACWAWTTFTTVSGTKYVLSADLTGGTGYTARYLRVGTFNTSGGLANPSVTTDGKYIVEFTATGTTTYISLGVYDVNYPTTPGTAVWDNISVKPAAYHGSMVDGVKCYDTDRSGNPISTSGSYPLVGYVPWEARTNIALQGNAFATAPWTNTGTPTITQNAIGPDGATSAWTLTDNDGAALEAVRQVIAHTAATHTISVFVKKTTGAQASYPMIRVDDAISVSANCTIDTTNGVATVWTAYTGNTIATSSATCISYNADFWRVSLTYLATAVNWTVFLIPAGTTNATQSTGVIDAAAQGSAVFYGAMVNLGAFAGPYQPTTTVAVARNADLLTYNLGSISNAVGWAYAEFTTNSITAPIIAQGNRAFITLTGNGISTADGASSTAVASPLGAPVTSVTKVATSWSASAATALSTVSGATPAVATFDGDMQMANIGIGTNGSTFLNGSIRNVRLGTRALSASELQAITA